MRVCFVVSNPYALNAFLDTPIDALVKEGWQVTVAVKSRDDEILESVRRNATIEQIDIVRQVSPWRDLLTLWSLWRFFRRGKFDVVHSITPKAGLLSMLAARAAGVPYRLHTFIGQVWVTRSGFSRWYLRALDTLLARCATTVLTDSPSQRDFLVAERVAPAKRLIVLAQGSICGVDTHRFRPDATVRAATRAEFGIPADAVVLLYVGRLHREKGLQELAAAFALVHARYPATHLVLAGPDEGALALVHAAAPGLAQRIHAIGLTRKPERFMAAADICCLPSYREGFGLSLIEGAACELPALATRIYGITDSVVDGLTGILVPPRDVDALKEALERLVGDDALRLQLGRAARQRAADVFSQSTLAAAWVALYRLQRAEEKRS